MNIPFCPNTVYKNDWTSWGDFLGNNNYKTKKYKSFEEFIEYIKEYNIKTIRQWGIHWRGHEGKSHFPSCPAQVYKDKWTSWPEVTSNYSHAKGISYSYKEAKRIVSNLELKSKYEYTIWRNEYCEDVRLPKTPEIVFSSTGEWIGWPDFLGKDEVVSILSFEEAISLVRPLKIKTTEEYQKLYSDGKLPKGLPYSLHQSYKNHPKWKGVGYFLGSDNVDYAKRDWISLDKLRSIVKPMSFLDREEYKAWQKKNKIINGKFIPNAPNHQYKNDGWGGWADLLGSKHKRKKWSGFLSFEEAKKIVHTLNIKGQSQWIIYARSGNLPTGIPHGPYYQYKDSGWKGWGDWLGTGTVSSQNMIYIGYEECKNHAQDKNIKSQAQWIKYARSGKKPNNIPMAVESVYKNKGWTNWGDFLGTGRIQHNWLKK